MPRRILTPELLATVPTLLEQGLRKPEIAARFGCTPGTLTVNCSRAKISLRSGGPRPPKMLPIEPPCFISRKAMIGFRQRAAAMGCSETKLASELLEMIARDDLYDAVLDPPRPNSQQ